jgi:hypothetical protein
MNHSTNFVTDREELKAAWRVLFFEDPPQDATWDRWYRSYGEFAPRMVREMMYRMVLKNKREHLTALQMENFANSILSRIDRERSETLKKLKSDLATMPGYDQLGDPRDVAAEQEKSWNK